jgi:hypothetical protein
MSCLFSIYRLPGVVLGVVGVLLSLAVGCALSADAADTPVIAYRVLPTGTERISPVGPCSETNPESLFLKVGTYCIGGQQWALSQGGGVRFYQPTQWNRYYIVHSGNLEAVLSAIAWGVSHGATDNAKSLTDLGQSLKTKKLVITCGKVSLLGQYLLKPLGVQSRLVSGLKRQPINGYDDSHALLEVKTPSGWQLVDLDNNRWFVDPATGGSLSALQVFQRVAAGESVQSLAKPLALDAAYAPRGFIETTNNVAYDYDFFSEDNVGTPEGLERWSKEVLSILGLAEMDKDGKNHYYFRVSNRAEQAQVLATSKAYTPMLPANFDARFYGGPQ